MCVCVSICGWGVLENVSTCTKIEMMRNALCTHTMYVHVVVVVEAGNVSSVEKIIHKVCHCTVYIHHSNGHVLKSLLFVSDSKCRSQLNCL